MKASVTQAEITPTQAEKWLESIPEFQRKMDMKQVDKLVMAINKKQWRENGATIVFNDKGELIDGQHRLKAISLAGKCVSALIVRGVDSGETTFHTIGDEKARKLNDFIRCKHANVVSSVVRMYWALTADQWPIGHGVRMHIAAPIPDMMRLAKPWLSAIESLVDPCTAAGRVVGAHSYCVFLMFYHTKLRPIENPERLAQFMARLADGVNLSATDPVYKLRQRFLAAATGAGAAISRTGAQALILKALNLYLDEKPCANLRFDEQKETFPMLRGFRK